MHCLLTVVQFVGFGHDIISASNDGTARIWDAVSGRCLHVLEGHSGHVNAVCVSECGSKAVTCSDDGTARVWDTETGNCLR